MTRFPVDFSSDTQTRPTPGMRQAIAQAEVGDEQKREDPSVNRLQEMVAELTGKAANWAAGLAWLLTLGLGCWLVLSGRTQIFFVSFPSWFVASIVYVMLSKFQQGRLDPMESRGEPRAEPAKA